MKDIKRYIYVLPVFIVLFLLIFICIHFLSKGYTNKYSINDISIKEIYTKDEQDEHDNYYIEITANNVLYNFQLYSQIKDNNKIVKDVIYYDGEYKCVLPVLSDDIHVDFLCYKSGEYYNYADIIGKDEKLDMYISKLSDKYSRATFISDKASGVEYNKITFYKDNIPEDYLLSITNIKGVISVINGGANYVELFEKDVYKRELSVFVDNYYVSANYDDKQQFSDIYVVDTITGKQKIIKAPDYISFDSYIQGVVDSSVYLYDINNEKQYKINVKDNTINVIGNSDKGIRYYDGNWSIISSIKANNKELFKDSSLIQTSNYYSYKKGNKVSGFYYYLYASNDGYEVYRANVQNKKVRKYLFKVKEPNDVKFIEEYVFYKDGDSIKVYSDYTGIKTIARTSELEYNENIQFDIYKK